MKVVKLDLEKLVELFGATKDEGDPVIEGLKRGLSYIPTSGSGVLPADYIDAKRVNRYANFLKKKGFNEGQIRDAIAKKTGEAYFFTDKARFVLLNQEIKTKQKSPGLLYKLGHHPIATIKSAMAPAPIEKILSSAYEIQSAEKRGEMSYEQMPQKLVTAVETLSNYHQLNTMLRVMRANEMISQRTYNNIQKEYEKTARSYGKQMVEGVKESVRSYKKGLEAKAAAVTAILLLGGFLLGFSSSNLTGFAIGGKTLSSSLPIALGFILLLLAFFLSFLKPKNAKKQPKKQRKFRNIVGRKPSRTEFAE